MRLRKPASGTVVNGVGAIDGNWLSQGVVTDVIESHERGLSVLDALKGKEPQERCPKLRGDGRGVSGSDHEGGPNPRRELRWE